MEPDLALLQRWMSRFVVFQNLVEERPAMVKVYPNFMDRLVEIIPALARLAESLEATRIFALSDNAISRNPGFGRPYPKEIADRRDLKLHSIGWCAFQIDMMVKTLAQSAVDWIAAMETRQDPIGHETCTMDACARNNIDATTYQQTHHYPSCGCQKLYPDVQNIMNILTENMIPLVRLDIANGEPYLSITAWSTEFPKDYIAISHVWADGLGGATEKGLNQCQVERLSKLCNSVNKSKDNTWFWLDSLCIPRVNETIHMKALVGIRDVYLNAISVLVVDKTIEQCTSTSIEKLYAHIYLSAWMQRMWTYEEAVLAKRLDFSLKDGIHTYNVGTRPSMRQTINVVWLSLASELFLLQLKQNQLNVSFIHRAFTYRLTNARDEEFLSISGMLGLDTQLLLGVKGEDRKKLFWLLLKWIPSDVLHLHCPKISAIGFRWAPTTMMWPTPLGQGTMTEGNKSECTEVGLVGTYLIVSFDVLLEGSSSGPGCYCCVRVKQSEGIASSGDDEVLLRLLCINSWPKPPQSLRFNTITLGDGTRAIPEAGEWIFGAALSHQYGFVQDPQTPHASMGGIDKFEYIGGLLVERLQNQETLSSFGSRLQEGSAVQAEGTWIAQKICIT
jgi:hypothetical protein